MWWRKYIAGNDGTDDGPKMEASPRMHSDSIAPGSRSLEQHVQTRQVGTDMKASATTHSGNPDEFADQLSPESSSQLPGPVAKPEDVIPAPVRFVRYNTMARDVILLPQINNLNLTIKKRANNMVIKSNMTGFQSTSIVMGETLNSREHEGWIRLNVGGQIFATSRTTLCNREPNSMLARMFCSDSSSNLSPSRRDETGAYKINRSPEYFEPVLNYLKHGELIIDKNINIQGLIEEADFFCIESLILLLKALSPSRQDLLAMMSASNEINLEGLILAGKDLSRLNLREANLRYADLRYADLSGANLTNSDLSYADLSQSNIEKAYLFNANLKHANLKGANLRNSDLSEAELNYANLSESNIENTDLPRDLERCNLAGLDLSNRYLVRVNLKHANLKGANLRNSDLSEAKLIYADLSNSNIKNTHLSGAILQGCNLAGLDLSNRDLARVNLKLANLKGANLRNSNLSGANLSYVDLSKSNTKNIDVSGAILERCNLPDLDLSNRYLPET